jgi:hypothetical protein
MFEIKAVAALADKRLCGYLRTELQREHAMTPELENMVDTIKQSVGLLRRRL